MWAYYLTLATSVASALPSQWLQPGPPRHDAKSVAYFLENSPDGCNIVSLRIGADGCLSDPTRTPTGGVGSLAVNATGAPLTVDTLGSQGSVVVQGDYLFTVNSGSNTLSMFAIDERDPLHPRLIGAPVNTLGQFPISVDYSTKLRQVCVLNGGAIAGVACFSVDAEDGLSPTGPLRTLPGDILNAMTPPSGPPDSAAQVLFDPNSTALLATIKGNAGSVPPKLGSFAVWPVEAGMVSHGDPVVTQISDVFMNFGFSFVDERKIFLGDPSFGAAILTFQDNLTVVEVEHVVIPGQQAVCWTQYWQPTETLYAIDAASHDLHTLSAVSGDLESPINVSGLDGTTNITGLFDSAISNGFMYSLTAENGISVINLAEKTSTQYFDLETFGQRQYYTGMATWTSW